MEITKKELEELKEIILSVVNWKYNTRVKWVYGAISRAIIYKFDKWVEEKY